MATKRFYNNSGSEKDISTNDGSHLTYWFDGANGTGSHIACTTANIPLPTVVGAHSASTLSVNYNGNVRVFAFTGFINTYWTLKGTYGGKNYWQSTAFAGGANTTFGSLFWNGANWCIMFAISSATAPTTTNVPYLILSDTGTDPWTVSSVNCTDSGNASYYAYETGYAGAGNVVGTISIPPKYIVSAGMPVAGDTIYWDAGTATCNNSENIQGTFAGGNVSINNGFMFAEAVAAGVTFASPTGSSGLFVMGMVAGDIYVDGFPNVQLVGANFNGNSNPGWGLNGGAAGGNITIINQINGPNCVITQPTNTGAGLSVNNITISQDNYGQFDVSPITTPIKWTGAIVLNCHSIRSTVGVPWCTANSASATIDTNGWLLNVGHVPAVASVLANDNVFGVTGTFADDYTSIFTVSEDTSMPAGKTWRVMQFVSVDDDVTVPGSTFELVQLVDASGHVLTPKVNLI